MDAAAAARRWADTWQRAWPARDVEAVNALYHPAVVYASEPFRERFQGIVVLHAYLVRSFGEEDEIEAWFADPLVDGELASVEWWATMREDGAEISLVGTSTLRFDADGLVIEQRDTWNQAEGRVPPYEGWGR